MGLAEKKIVDEVEAAATNSWKAEYKKHSGIDLDLTVDWSSFGDDFSKHKSMRMDAPNRIFKIVGRVLGQICENPTGREAFQGKVQKVKFTNTDDKGDGTYSISNGELNVTLCFADGTLPTDRAIKDLIEAKL